MRKFVLAGILSMIILLSYAQEYRQAIGIRGGYTSGFEYRAYSNEMSSYKVILSTRNHGIQLTGLKEFHQAGLFDFSDQLNLIYGFGAHIGFESWHAYNDPYENPYNPYHFERRSGPIVGLDALAAVEYNFLEVPLILGFEGKPYFNLLGKNFFHIHPFDFAFTIKYVF